MISVANWSTKPRQGLDFTEPHKAPRQNKETHVSFKANKRKPTCNGREKMDKDLNFEWL